MSLICLLRFSSSVWREANCPCSSFEACLPSDVDTIAWRTLSTPTLVPAVEPAAGADWAAREAAPARLAAARAAVNNILFTVVSLSRSASALPFCANLDWPKFSGSGLVAQTLTPKPSRVPIGCVDTNPLLSSPQGFGNEALNLLLRVENANPETLRDPRAAYKPKSIAERNPL